MAAWHRRAIERQRQAVGDAKLFDDQVHAAGFFRHRVLDLQARVDLQERQGAIAAEQELHRTGTDIARFGADRASRLVNALAQFVIQIRRWRFFDQLLVATLQRAVTGADHNHPAMTIGDDLRFDVPWAVQKALDEALATTERGHRFTHRRLVQLGDFIEFPGDFQAATTAAKGCLDGNRQAVLLGKRDHFRGIFYRVFSTGHQRCADFQGDAPGLDLVAQCVDGRRIGTDPDQTGVDHRAGEFGALREEAVARMNRIGTGARGNRQQLFDVQVGVGRALTLQPIGFIGLTHVQRVDIGIGVHRHRGDSVVTAGTGNTNGDFATIGNQNLFHLFLVSSEVAGRTGSKALSGLKRMRALTGICPALSRW